MRRYLGSRWFVSLVGLALLWGLGSLSQAQPQSPELTLDVARECNVYLSKVLREALAYMEHRPEHQVNQEREWLTATKHVLARCEPQEPLRDQRGRDTR